MLRGDSMLKRIDQAILSYWFTSPSQRLWAYMATIVPIVFVIAELSYFL